jgi:hypothetical protein
MDNATHCNDIYLNIIRYTITNNCYKTIQLCIYIYCVVCFIECMYVHYTYSMYTHTDKYIYI